MHQHPHTARRRSPRLPLPVTAAVVACVGLITAGCAGAEPAPPSASGATAGASRSASSPSPTATPSPTPTPAPTPSPTRTHPVGWSDPTRPAAEIVHGSRLRPQVALTFDADMTESMLRSLDSGRIASYYDHRVIDVLRAERVPATLFLTGLWMQRYPDVTRELAADPLFELGTHSWDHRAFTGDCYGLPTLNGPALDEVTRAQALLDDLAGDRSTHLFRFPGVCFTPQTLSDIAGAAVTTVSFDVAAGDGFQPDASVIVRTVLDGVQNGSIVVMHMHGGDFVPATYRALPDIIRGLRDRGFELVTVGTLLGDTAQAPAGTTP